MAATLTDTSKTLFIRQGSSGNNKGPQLWTYDGSAGGGNDSSAQIIGSGFFDKVGDRLTAGDIIFARNNNIAGGLTIVTVLAITAGVVTTKSILAVTT